MPPSRRLRYALTLKALDRFAGGSPLVVLDAGCGDALLAEAIASAHPDWRVVGLDANKEMLARGRAWAQRKCLPNLELRVADITGPIAGDRFDAALAIECLVEIPDDDAALRSIAAALRPGGLFLAHVPVHDWSPILPGSERVWRHEVRHGYAASEFAAQLERCGLHVIEVSPTSRGTVRVAQELRDRVKARGPRTLALTAAPTALAVWLERRGVTFGRAAALFVKAERTGAPAR
jgi:SAM-dependent methyltransferase